MRKQRISVAIAGLLMLIAATTYAGGWAIVTVNDFPEYGVVGKTATVTFSVRQHGLTLADGLKPVAFVKTPDKKSLRIEGMPAHRSGEYRFDLTFTQPGDWTVSIDSGFLFQLIKEVPSEEPKVPQAGYVSIPLKVIPESAVAPVISGKERGGKLFLVKGCAGCHSTGIGPDLSKKDLAVDRVRRVLADPAKTFKYKELEYGQMPNLDLKIEEIAALTEFLTGIRGTVPSIH
jgi:hypothetical protein